MQWNEKQVATVAQLARLAMSQEEMQQFGSQLGNILAYVEKLNALSTEGIEPTSHVVPLSNVFRNDVTAPSLSASKAIENAPDAAATLFRVPKIIE